MHANARCRESGFEHRHEHSSGRVRIRQRYTERVLCSGERSSSLLTSSFSLQSVEWGCLTCVLGCMYVSFFVISCYLYLDRLVVSRFVPILYTHQVLPPSWSPCLPLFLVWRFVFWHVLRFTYPYTLHTITVPSAFLRVSSPVLYMYVAVYYTYTHDCIALHARVIVTCPCPLKAHDVGKPRFIFFFYAYFQESPHFSVSLLFCIIRSAAWLFRSPQRNFVFK